MTSSNASDSGTLPCLFGGSPEVSTPMSPLPPLRWGEDEKRQLEEMLQQPSLFYWKGPQTELLIRRFQETYPLEHVMACSSGTAALHIAIAASGLKPGDEVIMTPITDMGTAIGVLYQQGVPVFADLDPDTYNLDPASVRSKITGKTHAIIAVHLAGNPCAMDDLRALADEFDLLLIEDCAQAWGARWDGKPVGIQGDLGCYSLNDFKHIGCGDGGIVASSHRRIGPLLQKFGDKAYDRIAGTRTPEFLAPNYRISEPQSAVAAAQMSRMEGIARRRHDVGMRLTAQLVGVPGLRPPQIHPKAYCTFWFYLMRLEESELTCDRAQFVKALEAEGVLAQAGYIPMPMYKYEVFRNHDFFGGQWPIRQFGLTEMDYNDISCPAAEAILASCIVLKIHQGMDEAYIDGAARALRKIAGYYARNR